MQKEFPTAHIILKMLQMEQWSYAAGAALREATTMAVDEGVMILLSS